MNTIQPYCGIFAGKRLIGGYVAARIKLVEVSTALDVMKDWVINIAKFWMASSSSIFAISVSVISTLSSSEDMVLRYIV